MFGSKQRSPALETPPADPLRAGGECGATDRRQRWKPEVGLCLRREGSGWGEQRTGQIENYPPFFCTLEPTNCSFSLWGFREQAVHV